MMDYLKSVPSVSMYDYMWKLTVPQIVLGTIDTTRLEYPKNKNKNESMASGDKPIKTLTTPEELFSVFSGQRV